MTKELSTQATEVKKLTCPFSFRFLITTVYFADTVFNFENWHVLFLHPNPRGQQGG